MCRFILPSPTTFTEHNYGFEHPAFRLKLMLATSLLAFVLPGISLGCYEWIDTCIGKLLRFSMKQRCRYATNGLRTRLHSTPYDLSTVSTQRLYCKNIFQVQRENLEHSPENACRTMQTTTSTTMTTGFAGCSQSTNLRSQKQKALIVGVTGRSSPTFVFGLASLATESNKLEAVDDNSLMLLGPFSMESSNDRVADIAR
jgi:hypothetical protein